MRVRLQLLLPLVVGLLMGVGFLVAGTGIADAVRGALPTVPGITTERAVEQAVRTVVVAGILVTFLGIVAAAFLARMIVRPLSVVRQAAERLDPESDYLDIPAPDTPVAEIQDAMRDLSRVTEDFRGRHEHARREGADLAALMDAVSEGILHIDAAGRIVRANRASRMLLRMPADAIGRPARSLLRNATVRKIIERAAREGAGAVPGAAEVVVDDRRILVSVSPQAGGGVVATLVDLTDLRRLEEVRRDFVANASHELKTPLTSIRGYSETLLGDDIPHEERRQFLATISRNAQRLQRIVDDLLDLSRLDAGRWEPDLEPLHALRVARAVWETFAERGRERGIHFAATAHGEDRIIADHRGLEQIFSNLYDNALRYTTGSSGHIRVTLRPGDPGPGAQRRSDPAQPPSTGPADGDVPLTLIEVSDTGTGIARDALPRIFERFYRVDPARSRSEGGTGLGLSIVKHMVESMGGHIRAESALGKGTTIRLWLPTART